MPVVDKGRRRVDIGQIKLTDGAPDRLCLLPDTFFGALIPFQRRRQAFLFQNLRRTAQDTGNGRIIRHHESGQNVWDTGQAAPFIASQNAHIGCVAGQFFTGLFICCQKGDCRAGGFGLGAQKSPIQFEVKVFQSAKLPGVDLLEMPRARANNRRLTADRHVNLGKAAIRFVLQGQFQQNGDAIFPERGVQRVLKGDFEHRRRGRSRNRGWLRCFRYNGNLFRML
ncbi:hypothetical protein Amal_03982 [Acetobacter malorum]|uniref:Uncharacterized protein n=1 Tax=Acetobacter malorum TaxID=178901 RepID=A0A177G4E0_9PROT|nr:hypothetical protein Amal_03982 [Acetobacter malorum]